MLTFAANLSWMFKEHDFLDRFAAAADAGFEWVEYLFPYDHDPEDIAARLSRHKLKLALFNAPPGELANNERGFACLPARRADFRSSLAIALVYARATRAPRLHVMAGIVEGSRDTALATYKDALNYACDAAGGLDILIEPLNPADTPGYLLNDFGLARQIIAELKRPNLKLQFDIYHHQMIHGEVLRGLQALLPITGHVQISSLPGRHEPTTGEVDDAEVLRALEKLGYRGIVGCEYNPRAGTLAGLSWMKALA
ncbi:MAG TPA: TIM barrel protein [Rhizomicrobium sp.]|nr:TIM barrel protein [Rhizomicrobium sp.]